MATFAMAEASTNPAPNPNGDGRTPYQTVDRFPSARDLLDTDNPRADKTTMFESYQEAIDWRGQLSRYEANHDPTIPTKDEQKKAMVKILFIAFKSIAVATDNENMIKPFREHRHDNGRVEVICWGLLESTIRRAKSGPLLYAYDPIRAKYNSSLPDFAARFDEMVTSLSMSKTICKHLYDAPYSSQFIDDPLLARKRVQANRELNKRKGKVMSEGRKLIEEHSKTSKVPKTETSTTPEGTGITQMMDIPRIVHPSVSPEGNGTNNTPSTFPVMGNTHDEHNSQGLVPISGAFTDTDIFPTPFVPSGNHFGSSFTLMNTQAEPSAPTYHNGFPSLYNIDPFAPSTSTFSMPTGLTTQFPVLSQPFDFGGHLGTNDILNDFNKSGGGVSIMTPRMAVARANNTRSGSSSSAYTPQFQLTTSDESGGSQPGADDSDQDPTYDPHKERSKKQRR